MTQPSLLDWQPPPQIFGDRDGETFNRKRDGKRLNAQMQRVFEVMTDHAASRNNRGHWFGLAEIASITGDPEASISARLRDLRKPKFGSYTIERRYVRRGLFEYRLLT